MAFKLKYLFILALAALLAGCARSKPVDELAVALTVAAVQTQTAAVQTQLILAPTLTPDATPTPGKCLAEATGNNVNMRASPEGGITGCCLAQGEELEVREFNVERTWAKIESVEVPAHRGWVDVRFLRLSGDCGEE